MVVLIMFMVFLLEKLSSGWKSSRENCLTVRVITDYGLRASNAAKRGAAEMCGNNIECIGQA